MSSGLILDYAFVILTSGPFSPGSRAAKCQLGDLMIAITIKRCCLV